MARELETAPIFIDAIKECSVKGGPLGGQTAVNLRNEHMNYVITWFSLTILTTYMWWSKFGKLMLLKK